MEHHYIFLEGLSFLLLLSFSSTSIIENDIFFLSLLLFLGMSHYRSSIHRHLRLNKIYYKDSVNLYLHWVLFWKICSLLNRDHAGKNHSNKVRYLDRQNDDLSYIIFCFFPNDRLWNSWHHFQWKYPWNW